MYKINYLIDEFMIFCESKNLAKKTMASYEQSLKLFAKYLLEEKDIINATDVTEKIIREYINNTKDRGKYTFLIDEKRQGVNNVYKGADYKKTSFSNNYK